MLKIYVWIFFILGVSLGKKGCFYYSQHFNLLNYQKIFITFNYSIAIFPQYLK
jgi:hypothetical protein